MFLIPAYISAALLLALAGLLKLRRPAPAAEMLASLSGSAKSRAGLVRSLAGGELALGLWALVLPSPLTAGIVAGAYAGMAALLLVLGARGGRQADCGCFGETGGGVGWLHVSLNLLAAMACSGAATANLRGWGWLVGQPQLQCVTLCGGILTATLAGYLAYTRVPAAWRAYQPSRVP
jgi:hypothetical protein